MRGLSILCGLLLSAFTLVAQGGIDPDEGPVTLNFQSSLHLKIALGAVEPLMTQGEHGIQGGAPDGHVSVDTFGGQTRAFFQCWDGSIEYSCLSETSSIDAFSSLAGLFKDPSGTHFQTVLEGPIANDPYESQYASLNATWRDPATGTIHGWYQGEVPIAGCSSGAYASILYATSTDGGHHFVKQGPAITSGEPPTPGVCGLKGVSLPDVIASGGWLYLLYDDSMSQSGVTIARASPAAPGIWFKYYNGAFSEPGLGGLSTPVIPAGLGNQIAWASATIWSSTAAKFLMVHTDYVHEGSVYLRTSSNLLTWTASKLLFTNSSLHGYRYPTLVSSTDDVMGNVAYLYFGRHPLSGFIGPDTLIARRSFTLLGSGGSPLTLKRH